MKKIVASTKSRFSLAEAYTDSGSNESAREALDANGRLLILAENGEDVTITAAGRATEKSERIFADVTDAGSGSVSSVTKLTADDYMNMDMYNSIALTDDLANPSTYMNVSSQKDAATLFCPVVLARYGYATIEFYAGDKTGKPIDDSTQYVFARIHFFDRMIQPGVPAEGLEMPAVNPDFMPGKQCGRPFLFDFIVKVAQWSSKTKYAANEDTVSKAFVVIPNGCTASDEELIKAFQTLGIGEKNGFFDVSSKFGIIDDRNGEWKNPKSKNNESLTLPDYIQELCEKVYGIEAGDEFFDIEFGIDAGTNISNYYVPMITDSLKDGDILKPIFNEASSYQQIDPSMAGLTAAFLMPFFRWSSSTDQYSEDGNYILANSGSMEDLTIANDPNFKQTISVNIWFIEKKETGSGRKKTTICTPKFFGLEKDSPTVLFGKTFNTEFIWERQQQTFDGEKYYDYTTSFYECVAPINELRKFSSNDNYDGLPEIDLNLNVNEKRNEALERIKNELLELYPMFDSNPNPDVVIRAFKSKHSSGDHAEQKIVSLFDVDYFESGKELICEFGGTASDGYQHYTLRVGSAEQATIDLGLKRAEDGLLYFTLAGNEVTTEKKIYIYGSGPDVVTINTVTNEHGYEGSYFGVFVFPYNVKLECTLLDEASGKLVYTVKKYSTGNDEPIQELVKSTMVQIPGRSWWPAISEASAGPIEGFYMCDRVVVQAEFERFCDYADMAGVQQWNAPVVKGNNFPATGNLWWQEALVYCNARSLFEGLQPCYSIGGETDPSKWPGVSRTAAGKLKCSDFSSSSRTCSWVGDKAVTWDKEANGYRLPTLREWLYAAYGSISTKGPENNCSAPANKYPAGDDWLEECILYDTEAKSKKPNDIGIYDLIGLPTICWPWNATNAWSDDVLQGRKNPDETGDYAKWWPSVTQLGSFGVSMQTDCSRKFMFRVVRSRMTQN